MAVSHRSPVSALIIAASKDLSLAQIDSGSSRRRDSDVPRPVLTDASVLPKSEPAEPIFVESSVRSKRLSSGYASHPSRAWCTDSSQLASCSSSRYQRRDPELPVRQIRREVLRDQADGCPAHTCPSRADHGVAKVTYHCPSPCLTQESVQGRYHYVQGDPTRHGRARSTC